MYNNKETINVTIIIFNYTLLIYLSVVGCKQFLSLRLSDLKWSSLQQRIITVAYQWCTKNSFHNRQLRQVDMDVSAQLLPLQSSTRGHTSRTAYSNSHFPRTIRDWNALDVDLLQFQSVDSFKHHLNSVQPVQHGRHYFWPSTDVGLVDI